ncbi:CAMK family protein kinase [Tritrichomonas foetus]|uniref:CAMK family protein kinase n=1 Tax=Tritrichomonas foetus TaxID=1144522 RepID=A0A1J4J6D6_9EUKA|nr:CAMK family protein kinase [Tritrichomonas foetus]|eukprot:OHS94802.1 CAMK family protein kinase [Tritrichomonas foetus]
MNHLTFDEKLKICYDIALGLKYCHSMSFAHRDIKAQNMLFDQNDRIKIADFGLSEFLPNNSAKISKHEGSLYYLSPEIINKSNFSPIKSDIWAFGVLLYRVFTGHYPFFGKTKNDVIKSIRSMNYVGRNIPCNIFHIVKKALVYKPESRATIEDMANDLAVIIAMREMKLMSSMPNYESFTSLHHSQHTAHSPPMLPSPMFLSQRIKFPSTLSLSNQVKLTSLGSSSGSSTAVPKKLPSLKPYSMSCQKKRNSRLFLDNKSVMKCLNFGNLYTSPK